MQVEIGSIIEGKISGIAPFGAFVALPNGKTGLIHISEVALTFVKDIKEHLKENDKVRVKVLSIDENGKVSLSIKKVLEEERPAPSSRPVVVEFSSARKSESLSFEDKMKMFMQESNEKMAALRASRKDRRSAASGSYRR